MIPRRELDQKQHARWDLEDFDIKPQHSIIPVSKPYKPAHRFDTDGMDEWINVVKMKQHQVKAPVDIRWSIFSGKVLLCAVWFSVLNLWLFCMKTELHCVFAHPRLRPKIDLKCDKSAEFYQSTSLLNSQNEFLSKLFLCTGTDLVCKSLIKQKEINYLCSQKKGKLFGW